MISQAAMIHHAFLQSMDWARETDAKLTRVGLNSASRGRVLPPAEYIDNDLHKLGGATEEMGNGR